MAATAEPSGRWAPRSAASLPAGVRISTKVPLDRPAPGTALGLIERSLTASLQRLRLPRVDLLLTHCWLLPDGEEGAGRSGLPFRGLRA